MQRLKILLIPGLIAIALFMGISTFESASNQSEIGTGSVALSYDAYAEGISTVLYDTEGNLNYTLNALSQIHYNDDTTELEKPLIELYQEGNSRWKLVADSGRIRNSGDASVQTIDLSGNVEVIGVDEYGNKMVMSTDYLSVNPRLETLQTDRPVTVVTDTVQQESIGLSANLKINEIILHNAVRGSYARPVN